MEVVAVPDLGGLALVQKINARGKLGGGGYSDIAVNDLQKGNGAGIAANVEDGSFDAGGVWGLPLEVFLGQMRIGFGLVGDGLNGFGAVDGLGGTGGLSEPRGELREEIMPRLEAY